MIYFKHIKINILHYYYSLKMPRAFHNGFLLGVKGHSMSVWNANTSLTPLGVVIRKVFYY